MSDVFISFVHEEVGYAEAVQDFIKDVLGARATPFLSSDSFQVYAGERWLDRIMSELDSAKVLLLMVSPLSVSRPWVNFEAGGAAIKGIPIIPVCYNGMLRDKLPKPYGDYQSINIYSELEQFYLVTSVAHHLGALAPPPSWTYDDPAAAMKDKFSRPYAMLRKALGQLMDEDGGTN